MSAAVVGVPTRIGIVGTGAIARFHLNAALQRPDEVTIAAFCDSNSAALQNVSEAAPDASLFSSVDALLASGEIDAGIIATPHFLHAEQAVAFARAGVPALVEKPLTISLDELRTVRAEAAATHTLIVAGQMHRFDRVNILARRWLDANPDKFGELVSFEMHCWQDILEYAAQVGLTHWLMDGRLAGGGVVVSLGVHQLDLVRYLGNTDYAQVAAKGSFAAPFHNGAESSASVLATMSNGATGTIFASYNAPRAFSSESYTLFGECGGIGRQHRRLEEYLGPLTWASAHDSAETLDLSAIAEYSTKPQASLVDDLSADRFVNQIVHFARATRGEVAPLNTLNDNFNTIACLEAINSSIQQEGKPVDVERS